MEYSAHMEDVMTARQTTKINVRVDDVLRGKLIEEAGDYGNVSNVVRVILEHYFKLRPRRKAK